MRHKCKLSFSILMISSCLVQIASAVENEGLEKITTVGSGNKVPKGSALVTSSVSNAITIQDGGVEIVDNGRTSVGATIENGGMQIVTRAGTSINPKILGGGQQFVFEEKGLNITSVEKQSSAYDATVSGDNNGVAQQNVYDGAIAWRTTITGGGEQNLYTGHKKRGGKSMDTVVSENGRQHVLALGESYGTTLKDSSVQVVYPGGVVDGLTINDFASSWIHVGVTEVGEVKVNDNGRLYLFAGDRTDHITKGKVSVTGRADEILFFVGERRIAERDQIDIEILTGEGGTVIFTSIPYDPRHILLHVEELSGNLHFRFNINAIGGGGDYLLIDDGAGNHKISVVDSGAEITGSLLQKNGFVTEINLATDKSEDGGANFTLANHSGTEISAVDGGTFMYRLCKRDRSAGSSGDYTIWYLSMASINSECSSTLPARTNKKQKVTTFSGDLPRDVGTGTRSRPNNNGRRYKLPPQPRPPRHLREDQSVSVAFAEHYHSSEEQEQSVVSANAPSFSDQILLRPINQNKLSQQVNEKLSVSDFLTTPSTDAVLSLSVTPALVFKNELQTVRAGRGILEKNKKTSALWTYAIKSKESVSADHIDFKLEQTGIIFGISGLSELANGEFYIGGFGSYDKVRVAHARGGVSGINTYGIGAYATYFDHSGWYFDSVLKYNHSQNTLNAVSTNGLAIEGNYNQWAVGTSFEAGYRIKVAQHSWIQPYAQLMWLQVEGKEIKLSNEMTGEINPFTSLRSEVGLSLGYEFLDGVETSLMGYVTAAWLRENKDDNHTMINKQHQFVTDLSGNASKLGIGLSSFLSNNLRLYAEGHYVKGHKTKQSLQGILGVRYSF
ncbi:BafA family autotransporter [Bartonella sp. 220]|uniref:BafA family autotransporter n=1 Tax=Bartonella sp. 220B TaxID=2967260 RepID=UPI0022A9D965|nr:BafA family autotransporter [Bartonella sp. 220B]MCZ2158210.1 BafA family autotransporter [Bartonella sp. 220B]